MSLIEEQCFEGKYMFNCNLECLQQLGTEHLEINLHLCLHQVEDAEYGTTVALESEEPNGNSLYTYLQNYCIKYHYV